MMGFFQAFFSQEKLFQNLANEFRWSNNEEMNSLIIQLTESFNDESINAMPAIIIQEGGWQEIRQSTGANLNKWTEDTDWKVTPVLFPYTIHCISQTKASAKLLQAAVSKGMMSFRRAICELGIDQLTDLRGGPPTRLSSPDETMPGPYDCTVSFELKHDMHWITERTGDPIEQVRLTLYLALEELEIDSDGNPIEPADEWIAQNISFNWE